MAGRIGEQELVVHLFAPLDGPFAEAAACQVSDLWQSLQAQLEMTQPIVDAGLGSRLPRDLASTADGALAGIQDRQVDFQAIARREHDVLNVSLVMATPVNPVPRRRFGLNAVAPPGWREFHRHWRALSHDGLDALLGVATVFLGKARDPAGAGVRAALPAETGDAAGWWTQPSAVGGLTVWDLTPAGSGAERRLVVLARPDEDARLSTFAWSSGDVALPPLGRYLMHAAKIRYHARVRGDGGQLIELRERASAQLDLHAQRLADGAAGPAGAKLDADETALVETLAAIREMRLSVEIARGNLAATVGATLPSDLTVGQSLDRLLGDDTGYLDTTRERAERLRGIRGGGRQMRTAPANGRSEQRVAFGVDVVGYSSRSTPAQGLVQSRLAGVVRQVLGRFELDLHDTDRQDAGDGMKVLLPPGLEPQSVLPELLHGWRDQLVADNADHPDDHIRVRLSVAAGRFTVAEIGFTGRTIIEVGRLLDSEMLRRAVVERPECDIVAAVSDRLYADVVGEGYPGLRPQQFERRPVKVKTFRAYAYLWLGR